MRGIPSYQVGYDSLDQLKIEGLLAHCAHTAGKRFWVNRNDNWQEVHPGIESPVVYFASVRLRKKPWFSQFRSLPICRGSFPATPLFDDLLLEWVDGDFALNRSEGKESVLLDIPAKAFIDADTARTAIEFIANECPRTNPLLLLSGFLFLGVGGILIFKYWALKLLEALKLLL